MAQDLKILTIDNGFVQTRADINIPLNSRGEFAEEPVFVSGTDKVIQDLTKGLLTVIGSHLLAPNYGTNLKRLIHARKLSDIAEQLTTEVQTLLGYLATFNADQPLDEQLIELVDLEADESSRDIQLSATVKTGTGIVSTVTVS
jgi:hypothetical protein